MATMLHASPDSELNMNFIIRHPALAALILALAVSLGTIALDLYRGTTVQSLWASLTRNGTTTTIMILLVYSVSFLIVSAVITGHSWISTLLSR